MNGIYDDGMVKTSESEKPWLCDLFIFFNFYRIMRHLLVPVKMKVYICVKIIKQSFYAAKMLPRNICHTKTPTSVGGGELWQ